MKDQAEKLRNMMRRAEGKAAKTIAVVSGKGGVGKSNISINMAIAFAQKGSKVLLFDLDIGMGNVHVLMGQQAGRTIQDFLNGGFPLEDIIYHGPEGVAYISGGNGLRQVAELDETMLGRLLEALEDFQSAYDYIIFDMGAGATSASLEILMAADDIFVVTTPEPTSITDAYSMMKYIALYDTESSMHLLCNRADNDREGEETLKRLQFTMEKFLDKNVSLMGVMPEDYHVKKAVIRQKPFILEFPRSSPAQRLRKLVESYLNSHGRSELSEGEASPFIQKLRRFFFERKEK